MGQHEIDEKMISSNLQWILVTRVYLKPYFGHRIKVHLIWEGHKFCGMSPVDLSNVVYNGQIYGRNFVAFSEYMNFSIE